MVKDSASAKKMTPGRYGKKRRRPYRALFFSLTITVLLLLYALVAVDGMDQENVVSSLLFPLGRLLLFIFLGLIFGQIIESTGWTKKLAVVAGPMFRYGNLGMRCSAAFTAAFVSGVASNAMLLGYYKDELISRRQLYLANFINQLPAYFLHLPTTFFIVVPLTGRAGLVYFGLTLAATLLRTLLFVLYGHFVLPRDVAISGVEDLGGREGKARLSVVKSIRKKIPGRITTIVVWVLPIYTIVFLLNQLGIFTKANLFLNNYFVTGFVPIEALSVVILSFAAEFTSGFAAAGAMLDAGVITVKQTVIALIVGNIMAFPLRALRHQLPRYIGIFSPRMGTQILLLGQGFRIVSLAVVTVFYYYFC
ncbi:nucleoside recognition protein [Desulfopila sp. IMCC35008]|uniref:nucleoside recognition protein n=1 Tax=Desulfopila sp. IMCC35008 TaxID=2653858 RepID=UPI001F113953|nr:nucleoside recognition protein [Desulfopila sp. IMCC35008]